ncbi:MULTISPECIES: hypothetical protein [Amycolatopsis]|uniref:Uncharacterized protein n=1 Tax=Amycolatopsis albidoflavus TaxID=102226 RepID=A0ABW5I4C2_9PSEU
MTEQKPAVGRIVHYLTDPVPQRDSSELRAECRAAIITRVWDDGDGCCEAVALTVFSDHDTTRHSIVPHNEDGPHGRTWHWPERV